MPIPKVLNIDVQQGNGSYNVTFDPELPCENCYVDDNFCENKKGAYGNKEHNKNEEYPVGLCLKHYEEATWLDKKAIITVREWF